MKKTLKKPKPIETRGRKKSERVILNNGFYKDQWNEVLAEAKKRNMTADALKREILDWYFIAKKHQQEREMYAHENEFKKLKKKL